MLYGKIKVNEQCMVVYILKHPLTFFGFSVDVFVEKNNFLCRQLGEVYKEIFKTNRHRG